MNISELIIKWYQINKRDLPWRNTKEPYLIWLSEIILQQTRVEQGLPYYLEFSTKYPSILHLAMADEDEVLKTWQGLGYYSRARNMHFTAKFIANECQGKFPNSYQEILKLKGVGSYTAAAIASFCFNIAVPVVDGNVNRLITRLFGIKNPIDKSETKNQINNIAMELLEVKNPGLHNQAMMEFGAIICKPQNPKCNECIIKEFCFAYKFNLVNEIPFRTAKIKIRERFFNYFFIHFKNGLYLNKRLEKDIWQNLWEFPNFETNREIDIVDLDSYSLWKILNQAKPQILSISPLIKHKLTHQTIYAKFFEINIEKEINLLEKYSLISMNDIGNYAFPKLIENYITKFL